MALEPEHDAGAEGGVQPEEDDPGDLVAPEEPAIHPRSIEGRRAQVIAGRHQGDDADVLQDGHAPGDDGNPNVVPETGRPDGEKVGLEGDLAVDRLVWITDEAEADQGGRHQGDVHQAGGQRQPGLPLALPDHAVRQQSDQHRQQGHAQTGEVGSPLFGPRDDQIGDGDEEQKRRQPEPHPSDQKLRIGAGVEQIGIRRRPDIGEPEPNALQAFPNHIKRYFGPLPPSRGVHRGPTTSVALQSTQFGGFTRSPFSVRS